ncbi:MAG: PAS domain S-box-containing protein [Desulforhopalus sp.]|jgi:PAS domain S-box-containing protein
MIVFQDMRRVERQRGVSLCEEDRSALLVKVSHDLAKRVLLGTVIIPLCLILVLLSSDYYLLMPRVSVLLCILMAVAVYLRSYAIYKILHRFDSFSGKYLRLLFYSAIAMAAIWGTVTALFIYHFYFGLSVFLVLIVSVGIGAGAISSFFIWRDLALTYLCFTFFPGIIVAGFAGSSELLPVVAAMVFFMLFNAGQLKFWNEQFWGNMLTNYLYKQQTYQLSQSMTEVEAVMAKNLKREQEAESAEAKMRQLFDYSYDGIIIADLEAKVLDVNQTMLNFMEELSEEVIGRSLSEILQGQEDVNSAIQDHFEKAKKGMPCSFSCWMRLKNSDYYVRINLRRVLWFEQKVLFLTLRDRTDSVGARTRRSLKKQSLTDSEVYMKAILQNIELPLYCKDLQGHYIAVNETFERICGKQRHELKDKSDFEVFEESVASFFSFRDAEIATTGESVELEGTFHLGGHERNLLIHKFPLKNSDHTIYATAGICTDVSTLQKTLHAAQLANEAKSEFLASMSHELRTPMHSILCFARLGEKRALLKDWDKLESYFKMIVTSGDLLLELLNDLLDLSTLESLPVCSYFREHDLGEDVEKIVSEFRAMMDEGNITLSYQQPLFPLLSNYNQIRIYQVLRNLLSNAIKFSSPGQEIYIDIGTDHIQQDGIMHPAWKVRIVDHGIGLAADQLELVFDKFVQGTRQSQSLSGVGLGLAICKRIIEDHNGKIWAEQNEPSGAIFTFLLPFSDGVDP